MHGSVLQMIIDEAEELRSSPVDVFTLIVHPWTLREMEDTLIHLPDNFSIETSPWYPEMSYGVINETEWSDRIEAEARTHRPRTKWMPPSSY